MIQIVLASVVISTPVQADEPLRATLDYQILADPYQNTIRINDSGAGAAVDRDPSSPYYGTIYTVGYTSSGYCDVVGPCLTVNRSLDGGRSFDGPLFLDLDLCSNSDAPYCVTGVAPPDIAVGNAGVVYVTAGSAVVRSVDRGVTWQPNAMFVFDELVQFASITADMTRGAVHVAGVNSSNAVLVTRSVDAGQTWSSPIAVSNRTTSAIPQIAAFQDSVVVAFTSGNGSLASVAVAASQDGGVTWPSIAEVSPPELCAGFPPSISVSPDGIFAVGWYATVPNPSGCYQVTATSVAISWDRGLGFSDPIEVSRFVGGAGWGSGDALVFDDQSRLYVTWNEIRREDHRGYVFVGHAKLGELFSTASFKVTQQGTGANGTSYQHLAAGLDGRVYLTWFDYIEGDEHNAYGTFFRGVSGVASGDVIPETQAAAGTVVDVDLVDPGSGAVRAQATWTGSPIVLAEIPPSVYDVWIRVDNASARAGAMPVRTWNRTAFTVHVQVVPVGPGPSPFPWISAAAVGGVVLFAAAALVALQHTRLAREEVLQRKVRLLIYETIREHPGSSFTEVRDAIGLQNGVAAYHLGVLEKQGLLHTEKGRRHRWYYPNGDVSLWRDLPLSPIQRALLLKVRDAPGVGIRELARSLNRRHGSVAYNVKGLARDGLLRTQRTGRKVECFPMDERGAA